MLFRITENWSSMKIRTSIGHYFIASLKTDVAAPSAAETGAACILVVGASTVGAGIACTGAADAEDLAGIDTISF